MCMCVWVVGEYVIPFDQMQKLEESYLPGIEGLVGEKF